jgi:hypothetical protein
MKNLTEAMERQASPTADPAPAAKQSMRQGLAATPASVVDLDGGPIPSSMDTVLVDVLHDEETREARLDGDGSRLCSSSQV